MTEGTTDTIGSEVRDAGSAGAGSGPPPAPTPAVTPPPRPPVHRRRWFLPVLVLSLLVIVGGALAVFAALGAGGDNGLTYDLFDDTYRADLTQGHGDFTVFEDGTSVSSYAPDGYHLVVKPQEAAMRAVQTNGSHTALGVRVRVRALGTPTTFAFGPACWHTQEEAYVFLVSGDGTVALGEMDTRRGTTSDVLRSRRVAPIDWSQWHDLRIQCSLGSGTVFGRHETATLRGYIDGRLVVRATSSHRADQLAYTGFMGANGADVPAEFVVRRFERLGPETPGD